MGVTLDGMVSNGLDPVAQSAPVVLDLRDVRVHFGGLKAVDGVTFRVREGEVLALIGPNGAGKTTLLNCISGYHHFQGQITYRGAPLAGKRTHEIARLGIGRTFQHAELVPHLSVLENILLGRHIHTRSTWWQAMFFWGAPHREQIEHLRVAEEVVEFLELERFRWKPATVLPHGVQRLVGLARALAMEPKLLLLDEPSSGMSREEREDFARFLIRLQRERPTTVVWIEHDMQLVRDLADRAVVMHYGRMIAEGSPDASLANEEVRSAYLGDAPLAARAG